MPKQSMDLDLPLLSTQIAGDGYSETYKESVFWCWYRSGKPKAGKLHGMIEPTPDRQIPGEMTLKRWIRDDFLNRAEALDITVSAVVKEKAITEKIEMLTRHAEIGNKMQDIAIEYLDEHKDKLNQNTAVRLLIEGIRIERESRGLPTMITQINEVTDEKLMAQIQELMENAGSIEFVDSKLEDIEETEDDQE